MSISHEQFKEDMKSLVMDYKWRIVERLEARDTAQREALARVEAERDRWIGHYNHLMEQHMPRTGDGCEKGWSRVVEARELQAQLAEAVALLQEIEQRMYGEDVEHRFTDLIADIDRITAQVEQQGYCERCGCSGEISEGCGPAGCSCRGEKEAQVAQAGDEREAFESTLPHSLSRETFVDEEGDTIYCDTWVQGASIGWNRRAALATQPAAGEPAVEFFVEFETLRKAMSIYGLAAPGSNSELGALMERYAVELIEAVADRPFPYPPAAAHGDEAVRKDATEAVMQRACAELPKDFYIEIHLENGSGYATLFNDGIVVDFGQDFESMCAQVEAALDAAMRAQGDGE